MTCCFMYLISISRQSNVKYTIGNVRYYRKYKTGTTVLTIICGLLIALRSKNVGIDTLSYIESLYESSFDSVKNYADVFDFRHTEIGFSFLMLLMKSLGIKQGLFVFEAFAIMVPLYLFIKHNSSNPYLSLLLFICLDYFGFALTGLRQTIAIGAFLMVVNSLNCSNIKKAIIYMMIAISIHTSTLIAIPIFVLKRLPLNKKMFFCAVILAEIIIFIKGLLISSIQEFGLHEGSVGERETGGNGYYYFLISIALLIFLHKFREHFKVEIEDFFYWMILVSVIMYPALQFNPTMFRLHYYYSIATIIVLPNLCNQLGSFGKLLSIGYIIIAIYYFVKFPLDVMGIVPYQFFV